jgi:hypothetical protein
MTEFQDIFANPLTIKVLVDISSVALLASALAAVWLCRPAGEKRPSESDSGKVGNLAVNQDR